MTSSSALPSSEGAVVLGGDYRGLGVVRSLGRRNIPVWVIVDDHTLAAHSRYCLRRLRWRGSDEESRVGFLLELGEQIPGWTLFPTTDEIASMNARRHAELSRYFTVTAGPWGQVQWALDKRATYRAAQDVGLPIPPTHFPRCRQELAAISCDFPAVVKPAVQHGFNRFLHDKGWIACNREQLATMYDAACELVSPDLVMIQSFIPGGGAAQFSCAALCRKGTPLALAVARRVRQYPLQLARSSTFVETVENATVERQACALLEAMRYTGLIELEFKFDARDGTYRLLDANPRIWGWHSLCAGAGVDFPYLAWRLFHNECFDPVRAEPGVRWVRMVTDIQALVKGLASGRINVRDYLTSLRGPVESAIFAKDDILPAILEVPLLAWLACRRGAI